MPLMDDTALIVTITKCSDHDGRRYNDVKEEYEYDSENRVIKMTEYTHGSVYDWYEYEYKMIGAEG